MHESLHGLMVLGMVIPLIILTLWLYKKTMAVRLLGNKDITLISQLSVGSKEHIILLDVKGDVILLGVTPQQISVLHVCNKLTEDRQS